MKDLKFYIIIGLLALGLGFLWMDNCGGDKKLNKLQGSYDALLTVSVREKKESDEVRRKQGLIIAEKDEEIIKIKMEAIKEQGRLSGEITVKERKLEEVREQPLTINRLETEIVILEGQLEDWKGKFTLMKKERDALEFSLNEKYNAQVVISLEWMGLYESELELRIKGMEGMVECIKRLNRTKLTSKVKTGFVVGLAIFVGYSLLK
jgi:hypothetical protein